MGGITIRNLDGSLRPVDVLALTVTVRDDRSQPLLVQRAKDDTYCLGHAARLARPRHV